MMVTVQITDVANPCTNLGERYTSASDLYSSGSRANSACSSSRRANVIFFRVTGVNNPEESLRPPPTGARRVASGKRCGVSMVNRKREAFVAGVVIGSREQLFRVSLGQKYLTQKGSGGGERNPSASPDRPLHNRDLPTCSGVVDVRSPRPAAGDPTDDSVVSDASPMSRTYSSHSSNTHRPRWCREKWVCARILGSLFKYIVRMYTS